ncbi:haloacid dehalogenase type II [Granulosicoccus antarcticus]|nr:haloacid dehalogenase type II [Granulosicoccus antarcticus]
MPNDTQVSIIVFDVNETLLDITTLEPVFNRLFCDATLLREWFAQLVLYSQTMTLSGLYTPFGELAIGTLRMLASIHGVVVSERDIDEMRQLLGSMPAHPDAAPALERLHKAGFRLVTLTNSASASSPTALEQAGLAQYFEQSFSVEAVRKFKPAPETYQLVADELQVQPAQLCLVACHLWDTIGAQAAGYRGAFLTRPHNAFLPADNVLVPDISASELASLADQIIARWGSASTS